MSARHAIHHASSGACLRCLRRSWLLSELSGPLDYCARDRGRLIELLALADEDLLSAVGGRRAPELRARYERFEPSREPDAVAVCRHDHRYPLTLSGRASPHMLELAGGAERLAQLTSEPVVAILGSRAASDYGMEMARSLARGLSASGVSVTAALTDGIAVAAHAGVLDAAGASIAVMGSGLGVSPPKRRRSLYERVKRDGCAVCELPRECSGRRWGQLAGERIVVELASLTVLVEADSTPAELAGARMALALGRTLAAVPGRITSPLARGPHALLMEGAKLIRGAQDALELLYPNSTSRCGVQPAGAPHDASKLARGLQPSLHTMLERVGSGCDTPDKLTGACSDPTEVLLALSELELLGLLARGDGGRYVLRDPLPERR
jgi:DNA processing protein